MSRTPENKRSEKRGSILVVEDDAAIAELLEWHLTRAGYELRQTADGEEALLLARETPPDLVLLDWMIEGISGLEVCRQLRRLPETANVPIVMLTARGQEEDKVRGLETGADDYILKPFSPRELIARIEAVLRRIRPALAGHQLAGGEFTMDVSAHRVTRGSRTLALGPTEFRILRYLLEHPGRVFSRGQLLDAIWGNDSEIELRTVDVHIRRLRQAINEPGEEDPIRTVRSAGYSFDVS
jgi:two-component system phosphate regulon response regulator PhoB